MKKEDLKLNPNRLVAFLEKPMAEFTKADILKVILGVILIRRDIWINNIVVNQNP